MSYEPRSLNPNIMEKRINDLQKESGGGGVELPIASAETLGGVKIGDGVNVAADGTISTTISMISNTDYLTNKVLNGKPVYMRYIDLTAAAGNRNVLTDVSEILSCNLRISDATRENVLPYYNLQYENSFTWRLNTESHVIEYQTSDSTSLYGIRGYIEFTKPVLTPEEPTENTEE